MLIKNGFIINPASGEAYKADIHIKDGLIENISENISTTEDDNVVDACGLIIAPHCSRTDRYTCPFPRSRLHL